MANYLINTETSEIIYSETGIWGADYIEPGGEFPGTDIFKSPWQPATQEEIDAYLLSEAKNSKLNELDNAFTVYEDGGYAYDGNTYCLKQSSLNNVLIVDGLDSSDQNAYTFRNVDGMVHDFENQTGWDAFKQAMQTERNRIMVYSIAKKVEINACSTTAEVEAVIINFSSE
jgi:hypothetical protein